MVRERSCDCGAGERHGWTSRFGWEVVPIQDVKDRLGFMAKASAQPTCHRRIRGMEPASLDSVMEPLRSTVSIPLRPKQPEVTVELAAICNVERSEFKNSSGHP